MKSHFCPSHPLDKPFKTTNLLGESSPAAWLFSARSCSSVCPTKGSSPDQHCMTLAAPTGREEGHLISPRWGEDAVSPVGPQPTSGWMAARNSGVVELQHHPHHTAVSG